MGNKPRKFTKRIVVWAALLITAALLAANMTMAAVDILEPKRVAPFVNMHRPEALLKIRKILEKKMSGEKLSDKAADKVFRLKEEEIQLIISLCDRIADDGRTARADIAYLLITALIVLS